MTASSAWGLCAPAAHFNRSSCEAAGHKYACGLVQYKHHLMTASVARIYRLHKYQASLPTHAEHTADHTAKTQ